MRSEATVSSSYTYNGWLSNLSMVFIRAGGLVGAILQTSLVITIIMLPAIFATTTQGPSQLRASTTNMAVWSVYGHDSQRTGRSDHAGPNLPLLKWYAPVALSAQNGAPLAMSSTGTIYAGSNAGLIRIDPQTGGMKTLWQVPEWSVHTVAILSDGTILAGATYRDSYSDEQNSVYAFDADGTQKWSFPVAQTIYNQMAIGADDTVYVLTHHGPLYAIDRLGGLRWMKTLSGSYGGVALAQDGTIYAATETSLTAYHPDGQSAWSTPIWVDVQLVVKDDGIILAVGYPCNPPPGTCGSAVVRTLFALHPDGSIKWSNATLYPTDHPSLGWDGTIYTIFGVSFHALNSDGTEKWAIAPNIESFSRATVVDANNVLYVSAVDGITALGEDGQVKWRFHDWGNPIAIAADGTLYYYYDRRPGLLALSPSPDFSISADPNFLGTAPKDTGTSTIEMHPLNGFTGTITLSASVSPSNGLTCTLTPTSATLGALQNSTLSCNGSVGTYTVTVTGTNGTLYHTATATYSIADFIITANPTSVTTQAGTAAKSSIMVGPVNGFTGTVTLASSIAPATGVSCLLINTTITGGSGASNLSCTGHEGTYTVTVTATSRGNTHSVQINLTIRPDSSQAAIFGLSPLMFYGGIMVVASMIIAGVTVLLRGRRGRRGSRLG